MIRVLIADDHPLVRRGLRHLLESLEDVLVVGEVVSGADVAGAVTALQPDIVLLDISMPGPTFLETLALLASISPTSRTLVVSAYAEVVYARRAIAAGAAGYVHKGHADEELVEAVRIAASGGRYISRELAQAIATDMAAGKSSTPHDALTGREHEVMLLLARGHTVTQISELLGLSVKTVSTHRTHILRKMELTTNAQLARYAMNHALME